MFHQVLDFFLAFSELSSPLEQFTYKDIGREFLFSLRHIGADFVKVHVEAIFLAHVQHMRKNVFVSMVYGSALVVWFELWGFFEALKRYNIL